MSDRIRQCQEADEALLKAARDLAKPVKGADEYHEGRNALRRAARAFAFACELAHVGEHETNKIDDWHEAYPLKET